MANSNRIVEDDSGRLVKGCLDCQTIQPLNQYVFSNLTKSGYASRCNACLETRRQTQTFKCGYCKRVLRGTQYRPGENGRAIWYFCINCESTHAEPTPKTGLSQRHFKRMGEQHKLTAIDPSSRMANCSVCGPAIEVIPGSDTKSGFACVAICLETHAYHVDHRIRLIDKRSKRTYHRLENINTKTMTGDCSKCQRHGPILWRSNGNRFICREAKRTPFDTNSARIGVKSHLKRTYGLSVEQYSKMLERQGHGCAICRRKNTVRSLAVDHDHATGQIRELLCSMCNQGLGLFQENPDLFQAAISYLEKHRTQQSRSGKTA